MTVGTGWTDRDSEVKKLVIAMMLLLPMMLMTLADDGYRWLRLILLPEAAATLLADS